MANEKKNIKSTDQQGIGTNNRPKAIINTGDIVVLNRLRIGHTY